MLCPAGLLYSESIRGYLPHEQTLPIFPTGYLNHSVDVRLSRVVAAVDFWLSAFEVGVSKVRVRG